MSLMEQPAAGTNFKIWAFDNVVYGPVELPTLIGWVKDERVTAKTWVFSEKDDCWQKAATAPELRMFFSPKAEVAAAQRCRGRSPARFAAPDQDFRRPDRRATYALPAMHGNSARAAVDRSRQARRAWRRDVPGARRRTARAPDDRRQGNHSRDAERRRVLRRDIAFRSWPALGRRDCQSGRRAAQNLGLRVSKADPRGARPGRALPVLDGQDADRPHSRRQQTLPRLDPFCPNRRAVITGTDLLPGIAPG